MFKKKEWKDRVSEYPTRRGLKKSDETVDIVTVSREEGSISVEGDAFSAENMNEFEKRIYDGFKDAVYGIVSNQYIDVFVLSKGFLNVTVMILNGIDPVSLIEEYILNLEDSFLPKYNSTKFCHALLNGTTYYNAEIAISNTGDATVKTRTTGTSSSSDISNNGDYQLYGTIMWENHT